MLVSAVQEACSLPTNPSTEQFYCWKMYFPFLIMSFPIFCLLSNFLHINFDFLCSHFEAMIIRLTTKEYLQTVREHSKC